MRPLVLALLLAAPLVAQDDGSAPGPDADKLARFRKYKAASLESNGETLESGGLPPAPKTDGDDKPAPTYQQQQEARRAGYDREFGEGSFQKVIEFSGKCRPSEGCDPSGIMNTMEGADKFVALQQDVTDKKVEPRSIGFMTRHGEIKTGLNTTLGFFRPRAGSRPEYVEEFVKVSDPIVKRIFSPEEMLALATRTAEETKTAPGYAQLGRTLAAQGQPERALPAFDAALSADPQYADALTGRAMVQFSLRRYPLAAQDAQAALALKPGDPTAAQTLTLAQGRLDQGTFSSLMKDPTKGKGMTLPTDAGLPDERIVGDGGAGASVTPAAAQNSLAAASPEAARARTLVADARRALKRGDYQEASRLLTKSLELDPHSPPALALAAITHAKLKDYRASLVAAEKGLLLRRGDPVLLTIKASAHNRLRDHAAALAAAELAVKADAKSAGAHFNRAEALAGLGRRSEALDALRLAAELDPELSPFLQMALQLPQDADLSLLFTDAQLGAAPSLLDRLERVSPLVWGGAGAAFVLILLAIAAVVKTRGESALVRVTTGWTRRITRS